MLFQQFSVPFCIVNLGTNSFCYIFGWSVLTTTITTEDKYSIVHIIIIIILL